MRTKTLVLSVALGVAGMVGSYAQVYSVNAVGYINLTLQPGFTMIANQLNDGKTPANNITNLLAGVPDGTFLYKWLPAGATYQTLNKDFGAWDGDATLNPGEGAFIQIPPGSPYTLTLVGEVPQGTALTVALPKGFAIASSMVPQTAALNDTKVAWPAADGDFVYRWDPVAKTYITYNFDFGAWDTVPTVNVGESFFVNKAAAVNWVRSFDVNAP